MPVRIRVARLPAAATAVVLTALAAGCGSAPASGGRPGDAGTGGGPPPALVLPAARQVLTAYASTINEAYLRRDPALLSPMEAGTSYRIDAGAFRWTKVSDPANSGYTKVGTIGDRLYVPRLAGWWAAYTPWTAPGKPGSKPFGGYVVFTKAARGWSAVLAPDVPAGVSAPPLATDRQGYATVVTAAAGRGLAAPLAQLPQWTVDALNAHANAGGCLRPGLCPKATVGKVAIPASAAPWDVHDQAFWAHRLPPDASDIDMHSVTTPDPVYALRTANGGGWPCSAPRRP